MDAICITDLYKVFGKRPLWAMEQLKNGVCKTDLLEQHNHIVGLNNINLTIPANEISVVMGLSGSGKSTLIRHINRLIEPTTGTVEVFGEDITALSSKALKEFRKYKASMVFQKFGLHSHKTIEENVGYGLMIQGMRKKDAISGSHHWLERVGLSGFEKNYPSQLSGGMQQRVGLARALATNSDILLMDEAFSALDPLIRHDMQTILLELQSELNKTIVFITHDLDEALNIGNTISILRDGEIVQTGTAEEIILRPADVYIEDFIKDINKGNVVRVSSIMNTEVLATDYALKDSTTLEIALEQMVLGKVQKANVINKEGTPMGSLALTDIILTLRKNKRAQGEGYS